MRARKRTPYDSSSRDVHLRFDEFHGFLQRDLLRFRVAPSLIFDLPLFQPPFADHDAMRDADQFHVRKHDTWTFVTIVKEKFHTCGRELVVQPIGNLARLRALSSAYGHESDVERGHRLRKYDPALVVVLLYRGRDDPAHADSVTAHFHESRLAGLVEKGEVH